VRGDGPSGRPGSGFELCKTGGHHELSHLVRATASGTFSMAGAQAKAMYAPEVKGRSAATVIRIRR
jgi:uncharacterized protein YfaS (alpha-2-macroglobulin family)